MAKTQSKKKAKGQEWTSLGVLKVTAQLVDKLAAKLSENPKALRPVPKHEAVHIAVSEALDRLKHEA